MRDFIEAGVYLVNKHFGVPITDDLVAYLMLSLAIVPIGSGVVWFYFFLRRWRGDFRAVSGELAAVTHAINTDTRQELDNLVKGFSRLHEDLKGSVHERFDALQGMLKSRNEVESLQADTEVEAEPVGEKPASRGVRLAQAENVRNAVLQKWVDGRYLARTADDPNCYDYSGVNEAGQNFYILLQTPYRACIGSDGRLPFTIELWVDGYKKLNFEWDSEGNYALRGYKRGDWFVDVADWALRSVKDRKAAA